MIVWLLCVIVGAGECTGNGETGPSGAAIRPTRTGGDIGYNGDTQGETDTANKDN